MKILAKEKLSEHKYKTPEGYLICVDSVLARTGKQTYTRDELFHDGDETEIEVDRTPEEVFSDATLASFENKPLVVEHPDEDVNSSNIQQYAVGFVRDVKRGELDGEPVMLGTLVITDEQTIKEIEDGEHTDLSCGYDCDIQDEAEPSQKNIRGNHVALCQTGRAGIARIVDSVKDATYSVETSNTNPSLDKTFNNFDEAKQYCKTIYKKGGERTEIWKGNMLIAYITKQGSWWFNSQYHYDDSVKVKDRELLPNVMYIAKSGTQLLIKKITAIMSDYDGSPDYKIEYSFKTPKGKTGSASCYSKDFWRMLTDPKLTGDSIEDSVNDAIYEVEYFPTNGANSLVTHFDLLTKAYKFAEDQTSSGKYKKITISTPGLGIVNQWDKLSGWKTKYEFRKRVDSVKDSQFEEYMRKLAYIDEYWQVSKMLDRAYNELPTDDYKRLYKAAQERKKEILAMHDSNTKDKLIESGSKEAFKKNIATEIRSGKDPKQAAAIAYSVQRENDSDVEDVVQFDALKDAPSKGYAITKIKEIIKNPRYTSEDNEGVVYLTQEGYKLVQQLAKSNGLDRKDMENISWYMFGPGGYPSIVDSDEKVEDANTAEHKTKTYYVSFKEPSGKFAGKYVDKPYQATSSKEAESMFRKEYPEVKKFDYKVIEDSVNDAEDFPYNNLRQKIRAICNSNNVKITKELPVKYNESLQYTFECYRNDPKDVQLSEKFLNIPYYKKTPELKKEEDELFARKHNAMKTARRDFNKAYSQIEKLVENAGLESEIIAPGAGGSLSNPCYFVPCLITKKSTNDSVNDKLIDPPENILSEFENKLKAKNVRIASKGKTIFGSRHYQLEYDGKDRELHNILKEIDRGLQAKGLKANTWSIGYDKNGLCTAGVDIREQYIPDSTKDAMEKYYIRWIDQYSKSKGYDKSFWLYDDEVKANSAKEALDKLANITVMRGVGTRYVTIVNIKTDKTSYQVSGNIDDLRKRQLDSMASTYERATKGLKAQLNNVGDSCKVGKYKVTKIK